MNVNVFRFRSLKARVTLLTLVIFTAGIGALSLFAGRILQSDTERLLGEQQLSTVTFVAAQIGNEMQNRISALTLTAQDLSEHSGSSPQQLQAQLLTHPVVISLFNTGVFLTNAEGTAVASAPADIARVGINYADREYIAEVLRTGKSAIGKPVIGKVTKSPLIGIAVPVRDARGEVSGALVGVLDLAKPNFLDKLTQIPYGKSGGFLLIAAPHRQVITATDKNRIMEKLPPVGVNRFVDRNVNGYEGYSVLINALNQEQLASIKQMPELGWYLLLGTPSGEAFGPIQNALYQVRLAALALIVLACALTWWVLKRQLQPLDATASAMEALSRTKHIPAPLPVHPLQEIGQLAGGFNRLIEIWEQREAALRDSERDLYITLQSIGDAVIATDAGSLITRMNPAAEALTGWTFADAQGKPLIEVFNIINAQTRKQAVNPVDLVLQNGETVGLANHTALIARDGSEYQIFDSASPIRVAGGPITGVVLVFSDVTQAYRIQESLRQSEELFRASFAYAGVGMSLAGMDGRWIKVNQRLCEIVGYTEAELLQKSFQELTHPDDVHLNVADGKGLIEGKFAFFQAEKRYIHKDGHAVWARITVSLARGSEGEPKFFLAQMEDISERKLLETSLQEAEATQRATLSAIPDLLFEIGLDGVFHSFHTARANVFTQPTAELVGRNATDLLSTTAAATLMAGLRAAHSTGQATNMQILMDVLSGEALFELSIARNTGAAGKVPRFVVIARDITERRAAQDQIQRMAFYDPLTQVPNRRLLMDRLRHAMASMSRHHRNGALLFVDLDNFKVLNDTLGHNKGDLLLQQVAQRLTTCIREGDTVARLGGDEFVVMLENLSEDPQEATQHARAVGEKVLVELGKAYTLSGLPHTSTPSIGVTLFGPEDEDIEEPLKRADLAMYQAKAAGRNTLRFFDPQMQLDVNSRSVLETGLRDALGLQQFHLCYQIQVNSAGDCVGAEALLRWSHPQRGMVSPADFIPLAESTGLIIPIGQWVLDTACSHLAQWAGLPSLAQIRVSVNISPVQFHQQNFVEQVLGAVERAGADPHLLKLELTESLMVSNMQDVISKMNRLKAAGIGFSLDDFGTGYSSLSYLKLMPLEQVKIDQSFIRNILHDANDAAIARMIIVLAESLKLEVIAEGVETAGQRDFLATQQCHVYQGYLFSRPLPVPEFEALVQQMAPPATH